MGRPSKVCFWSLIGCFLFLLVMMFGPEVQEMFQGSLLFLLPFAVFFLLGLLLAVAAWREPKGWTRTYMLVAGLSASGIFVGIILHNLVYALFILLFGEGFWERVGLGDEPVFFLLSMLVLPALFLIGAIGGAICLIRERRQPR